MGQKMDAEAKRDTFSKLSIHIYRHFLFTCMLKIDIFKIILTYIRYIFLINKIP